MVTLLARILGGTRFEQSGSMYEVTMARYVAWMEGCNWTSHETRPLGRRRELQDNFKMDHSKTCCKGFELDGSG